MKGQWARWTVMAVAASLLAAAAQADETKVQRAETRVEVRVQKPGEEPGVRVWVNGKEVRPGEPLPAGADAQISVHASVDADGPGGKKTQTKAAASRRSIRVEARSEKPGEEPVVRMWVDGKEVEPGKAIDLGGKGRVQVQVQASARSGRKTDERREEARPDKDRGVLGVMIAHLDDETAKRADVKAGAVVQGTTPGSAARKAGLREGDVITAVDGKRVESPRGLADYIGDRHSGDRVRLEWSRDGRRMRETVILGTGEEGPRPETVHPKQRTEQGPKERRPAKDQPAGEAFLGVMAAPLTDEVREIAGTDKGVLINSLTDGSPAAKGGLQPGDVIVHIDDRQVHSPGELVEAVGHHKPGDRIHVVYYRMGKRRETQVALGRRPGEGKLKKDAMPLFDLPGNLFGDMPQLRKYFEQLRPDLEEWTKRFRDQQGKLHPPAPAPKLYPGTRPDLEKPKPEREPYDVGKDMGRILERLERIERRLDEMEKRLQRRDR